MLLDLHTGFSRDRSNGLVSKSKPGAWALTLLLVLQEEEQELDGEEGPPQAGPEEEDGEWDPASRLHIAAPEVGIIASGCGSWALPWSIGFPR